MVVLYNAGSWKDVILTWTGSPMQNIWPTLLAWAVFVVACFFLLEVNHTTFGTEGHCMLGGTMSTLLIFRANAAYARFWKGRTLVTKFFTNMRDLMCYAFLYVKGGESTQSWRDGDYTTLVPEDENDLKAREFRINLARLCLALGVVLKAHTRLAGEGYCFGAISAATKWDLDWERLRLRHLLYDHEFQFVDRHFGLMGKERSDNSLKALDAQFKRGFDDGPPEIWPKEFAVKMEPAARAYIAVAFFIKEQLMDNMNDPQNSVPHGVKERFVPQLQNLVKSAMGSIEDINVIIATPLPLPYANLCKLLLTLWMFSFPFVEDFSVGLFGGIAIPIVIMGSLLAIDLISTELENPFGDDTNDLDLIEQIHILECEALEMLEYCGDFKARSAFIWRGLPDRMADTSCKPVTHQLALAKLAEGFQDVVGGRTEKTLLSFQDGQFGVKDLRGSTPARGMSKGVAGTAAKALAKAPLLDPPPPPQSSVARSYSGGSLGSAEEEADSDESDSEEER